MCVHTYVYIYIYIIWVICVYSNIVPSAGRKALTHESFEPWGEGFGPRGSEPSVGVRINTTTLLATRCRVLGRLRQMLNVRQTDRSSIWRWKFDGCCKPTVSQLVAVQSGDKNNIAQQCALAWHRKRVAGGGEL